MFSQILSSVDNHAFLSTTPKSIPNLDQLEEKFFMPTFPLAPSTIVLTDTSPPISRSLATTKKKISYTKLTITSAITELPTIRQL